ncbi:MAG: alpha/beta hydrolase, partial [Chitinophagaceae bacterium]
MKKIMGMLAVLFFVGTAKAQTGLQGTWEGKLSVGNNSLRLVIHIKGEEGAYSATLDSPDQGAKGIPVSSVKRTGDSLVIEVAAAAAKLSGKITSDSTLAAQWQQGGAAFPIALKKTTGTTNTAPAPNRPQTPVPPFSYSSTDVRYHNPDKSIQFGATVTKPFGNGP